MKRPFLLKTISLLVGIPLLLLILKGPILNWTGKKIVDHLGQKYGLIVEVEKITWKPGTGFLLQETKITGKGGALKFSTKCLVLRPNPVFLLNQNKIGVLQLSWIQATTCLRGVCAETGPFQAVKEADGNLNFSLEIPGQTFFHKSLAPDTVTSPNVKISGTLEKYGQMDENHNDEKNYQIFGDILAGISNAHFTFDGLFEEKSGEYEISLKAPCQSAKALLMLIPEGARQALNSLEVQGDMSGEITLQSGPRHVRPILNLNYNLADLEIVRFPELNNSGRKWHVSSGLAEKKPLHHRSLIEAAVILAEDANFYHHSGIEPGILGAALTENLEKGRFVRGGGTIPMQVIRNLYLSHEKTVSRKMEEIILTALATEKLELSKADFLETYLNIIEWGFEIKGIEAASSFYFDKKPAQLALNEILFLCAIIPNPRQGHRLMPERESPAILSDYLEEFMLGMEIQLAVHGFLDWDSLPETPQPLIFSPLAYNLISGGGQAQPALHDQP